MILGDVAGVKLKVPSQILPANWWVILGRGKYRLQPHRAKRNAELVCCATSCLDSAEGRRAIEKYEEMIQLLDR